MVTQAERRTATRSRLLDAAEALFASQGFDHTSTEQILDASGSSRGALYHHFEGKHAVFEAVFLRVSDAAIERAVRAAPPEGSPLEALIQVCLRWLREVRKPKVAAILIEQGPQVLGWERARAIEARTSLGLMMKSLERAASAGELRVESIELAARFVNAALAEAALAARHARPKLSQAVIERSVRQLIEGLGAAA